MNLLINDWILFVNILLLNKVLEFLMNINDLIVEYPIVEIDYHLLYRLYSNFHLKILYHLMLHVELVHVMKQLIEMFQDHIYINNYSADVRIVFYALLTVRITMEVLRKKKKIFYLGEHNVRLM